MSRSRSRSSESGQYVTADEAAAHPSTTVQERPPKKPAPLPPLSDEESTELVQVIENATDLEQVVDYVNMLIAKRSRGA
jgi:hypothetical protein